MLNNSGVSSPSFGSVGEAAIIPPYLQPGDRIGLVCPAGYMPFEKFQTCIQTLQEWGYQPVVGKTPGHQYHYFSGTDAERQTDLQQMLDETHVKAVLCARGGYGTSRMIDELNWEKFKANPKWVIGFSDITVLHSCLLTQLNTASLHAPMAAAFNDGEAQNKYIQSLRNVLSGQPVMYETAAHPANKKGSANGILAGGNLTLLAHQVGTATDIDTAGKILFVEDIGEYYYAIDRLLVQLQRSGKLKNLAGLIVGHFSDLKDTTVPFGQTVEEMILEKVKDYDYPVCFNFPVGHDKENVSLKIGVWYRLIIEAQVLLIES